MINKKNPIKRKSAIKSETGNEEAQNNIESISEANNPVETIEIVIESIEPEPPLKIE